MKKRFHCLFTIILVFCCSVFAQEPAKTNNIVLVSTEYGDIKIRLYDETPMHRDNFLKLVSQGFYDSTLFHRVIRQFMIQGGDPNSRHAVAGAQLGDGDVGYTIPAEIRDTIYHKRGVLAAARDNNPAKASSGCQFYIVQGKVFSNEELDVIEGQTGKKFTPVQRKIYTTIGGTPHLDGNYTVYGEVIEGMDVVDKIAAVATDTNDRPARDVRMKIKLLNN